MDSQRFPIDVGFKGERPYLQSADIFDAIVARTGARRDLRLTIRRLLSHPLYAVPAHEIADPEGAAGRFRGHSERDEFDFVIVEHADMAVASRVPYDEQRVVADACLEGDMISSRTGKGASTMERVVALNKLLIHSVINPGKKLLFSSVTLSQLPEREAHLTVRLEARLGTKLYRSSIARDGRGIGEITFYGV